ncbi:MAG: hypothetical protein NUV63_13085 [Gallionella sp.]|nr:hypothetical protein [Gallionella sp.]
MNTETQAERQERVRKEFYKRACDEYDELERVRLNKIFAAPGSVESHFSLENTSIEKILDFSKTYLPLEEVRNGVESGDRRAMLELLAILTDSLRLFEILPREVRLAIADGLEKMQDNLKGTPGFLPRKRGEISNEVKLAREKRVLLMALEVELYRFDLSIGLDEAEAKVAEEHNMKQDVIHKYWQKSHHKARQQIEMGIGKLSKIVLEAELKVR